MDWVGVRNKAEEIFRKYKYVALVLGLGIFLMLLPDSTVENVADPPLQTEPVSSVSEELENILSQIDGVGKVKVMLTEKSGGETIYQTDEDRDDQSIRVDTVIVTDSDRAEQGLIKQLNPPVWMGAIVVCQGAEHPVVRLSVVEAVANVTGISTDRITVVKMK